MYASLALALPNDVQPGSGPQTVAFKAIGLDPAPIRPELKIIWHRKKSPTQQIPSTPTEIPSSLANSDLELLDRVRRGDDDALAALYDRHGRTAFSVAYRILEDHAAAEDAVQDALLSAWRQAESYRPQRGAVRTWLMAITRNAAIDRRRGRQGRACLDRPLDDVAAWLAASDDPDAETMTALLSQEVRSAISQLPPEQHQVIDLAFFAGLTHHEIADRLGIPLGTVKGRIRLALHKLQLLLSPLAPATR